MKSIAETHPWLIAEWHDGRDPSNFTSGCCKKAQWKCKSCGHVWSTRIQHRANGRGCPVCGVEKVKKAKLSKITKEISFLMTHPDLSKEWHESNELRPENTTSGCNRNIKWVCSKCNNTWNTTPNARSNRNHGCPYCHGRKTIVEKSLAYTHPELCKEWHDDNIHKPTDFSHGSSKRIKWICKTCDHVWHAIINNRTKRKECPACSKSNPVKKIIDLFNSHSIDYKMEYRFPDCKNQRTLPFDFVIFKDNKVKAAIEYQGRHHFEPIWGKERFAKVLKNDKIKKEFCIANSIQLIEITVSDDIQIGLFPVN